MNGHIYDYIEAGFKVFGIHGVDNKGNCECGNPKCKALYKHPVISGWQNVPHWSDEQIETFDKMGHFDTGVGVLCSGWLIIDVDARNGGVESFKRLREKLDIESQFVVDTGSGGGSQHHYFKMPEAISLQQHHDGYPGIDFKSSGYVIGAGSRHASGMDYEVARGFPQDVTNAPEALIDLLRRPEHFRVTTDTGDLDIDEEHIKELLGYISPDCGYEEWIKAGMAIHHSMGGLGLDAWVQWSEGGSKYPGIEQLHVHWHSFGKSPNPAGYGTLLHYARKGGYCESVEFVYNDDADSAPSGLDTTGVDLLRPPGFVGELCKWINSQCLYPRESLAVAASLCAVSNLAGMRHIDDFDRMTANIIAFCVAGSGSGKEAIQQAYLKIMRVAGVQAALHGGFKSEQEIMRNLVRHQAAFYSVDELGMVLNKLENASKRGGASYLEGIIGLVMSVYSKADGYLPITGDLKEEVREKIRHELSRIEKRIAALPGDSSSDLARSRLEKQSQKAQEALSTIDSGLDSPYLTIIGYTTPVTFSSLMGFEQATNGFLARAMIFNELETNPKRKEGFKKEPMSEALENQIRNLYAPGCFDMLDSDNRIEYTQEKTRITTTLEGVALLKKVSDHFYEMGETHKSSTGLEAITRRGYEITSKVSLILAMSSGIRTAEHVLWGFALADKDIQAKIKLAYGTENPEKADGLAARVLSLVDKGHGETLGVICNRLRSTPKEQIEALLGQMVDKGMLKIVESIHPANKKTVLRYFQS